MGERLFGEKLEIRGQNIKFTKKKKKNNGGPREKLLGEKRTMSGKNKIKNLMGDLTKI